MLNPWCQTQHSAHLHQLSTCHGIPPSYFNLWEQACITRSCLFQEVENTTAFVTNCPFFFFILDRILVVFFFFFADIACYKHICKNSTTETIPSFKSACQIHISLNSSHFLMQLINNIESNKPVLLTLCRGWKSSRTYSSRHQFPKGVC